jgi:hypothetical protein
MDIVVHYPRGCNPGGETVGDHDASSDGSRGKLEAVSIGHSEDETEQDLLRLDFAHGIPSWMLHNTRGIAVGCLIGLPTRAVKG